TSPLGSCHYSMEFPLDDLLLGTDNFNKVHAPGNGPFDDSSILREQTCFWLVRKLGLPWLYRRYVAMYVNGSRRGQLMEDSQVPGSEVIDEHFPDDVSAVERSEEHTSELQSPYDLVCRLLLEKKKTTMIFIISTQKAARRYNAPAAS